MTDPTERLSPDQCTSAMAPEAPRHLLTVLHAAERTGPPVFALRFLRWLAQERPSWRLSTLFLTGGDFAAPFEQLGAVLVREPLPATGVGRLNAYRADQALRRRLNDLGRPDLSHVHCAGSMRVLGALPESPVLAHVHEMSVGLELHMNRDARRNLPTADRFVAVSDAVRRDLLRRFAIDPERIERQWGFVDRDALPEIDGTDRQLLGADPSDFVVVGSGVRNWRKAPELFLRVAQLALRRHPTTRWRFVWVGGSDDGALARAIAGAGLEGHVEVVPHVENPLRRIGAADVFLLTAREDAFPLVSVEAAALGRPIVSFDSGGTPELIEAADCGIVVPFPDVARVADELQGLAEDAIRRRRLGDAAAAFARDHLTLETAGPRLLATIESTMTARGRG